MSENPPWVWGGHSVDVRATLWQELAEWVDWLEVAYAPWVALPPCWPVHEGLRTELTMFWYWHRWVVTAAVNPIDGVSWHRELRSSALEWRQLATCRHEPPIAHQEHADAARRARRDEFLGKAQQDERSEL